MPLRYTRRILDHLAREPGREASVHDLARAFRLSAAEQDILNEAVQMLVIDEVVCCTGDRLKLQSIPVEVEGVYRSTRRGFGFVKTDQPYREGDVYIARGAQGQAISGDRVRCSVARAHGWKQGRPSGKVTEVLEVSNTTFAGTVIKRRDSWLVQPDGRRLRSNVVIRDPGAKDIKPGQKVVFELVAPPEGDMLGEGVVTEVLGEAGEPHAETESVIAAHGIRTEFDEAVLAEAREASTLLEGTLAAREDMRQVVTFTIDPPDARDFDDAISVTWDEGLREWELAVHIADVAFFVPVDGPLDVEARARGNSTYLPRRVIPMLPEVLSNGVCSLQEDVDRCAKTAIIRIDERGRVNSVDFRRTLIRSNKRFSYLEAQAWIDGDSRTAWKHAGSSTHPSEEVVESLRQAARLAEVIQNRRRHQGMISLALPESVLVFDDEGRVADVQGEDGAFTHTLIEMFMVEANEAVSRLFDSLDVSILRRIHPEPALEDLQELRSMAMASGHRLPEDPGRRDLQQLLDATRDSDSARAVHFAVLRTLTRAEYSPAIVGHFALASEHYAHFTSPIRRYPDLVVHRALDAWLDQVENGALRFTGKKRRELTQRLADDERTLDQDALVEMGRHCTDTENESEAAERELREFLVLQHLEEHHLGEDLPGVVRSFTPAGVLVELDRFLVTGHVGWDDMGTGRRDRWEELPGLARIVARGSGHVLAAGDPVEVRIVRVDAAERNLELMLTKRPQRTIDELPLPSKRKMERDRKRAARGGSKQPRRRQGRR
ncbi:MAG: VacB/RNase II family 3'-5' exoribonuclease [Phycisphaerales bacterium]|nr:VacB/RNase II family 3'-5' exoribonuclease [Phycisphaerales bacterium]